MLIRTLSHVMLYLALGQVTVLAQDRPITGRTVPGLAPLDKAVLEFMELIDADAATIAASKDGRLVYSRGFGWLDQNKEKPLPPDALMRIASVSKPITKIMIMNAVRNRLLSLDARAFDLIGVKPFGGKLGDPRIAAITVGQLVDHKGGWDRAQSFDPMFRTSQIEKELGLDGPATPVNVIEFMLAQPLQFSPGEQTAYSNFGYCVLGRVLEKISKKPYGECLQLSVCRPLGIKDLKLGVSDSAKRDPREVYYPVADNQFSLEVLDAHGGLIASAPALCQVLESYSIGGEPKRRGQRFNATFFGSLPGTTAMVRQREDGVSVAVLLNQRREAQYNDDNEALKRAVDRAIDSIQPRR